MTSFPDPHTQAALMLFESLALLLIENGVLPKQQVVEAIEGVIEVKQETAAANGSIVVSMTSIRLLQAIARSISAAASPG